jgi:hypothetical protein
MGHVRGTLRHDTRQIAGSYVMPKADVTNDLQLLTTCTAVNMLLTVTGAKLGAPDASVTARGHDFSQALMAVLKDCLSQMGYSKRRAHAAAQGEWRHQWHTWHEWWQQSM